MGQAWRDNQDAGVGVTKRAEAEIKRIFANWQEFTENEWIMTVGMVRRLMLEGKWREHGRREITEAEG